jgi:hypothetical protein
LFDGAYPKDIDCRSIAIPEKNIFITAGNDEIHFNDIESNCLLAKFLVNKQNKVN